MTFYSECPSNRNDLPFEMAFHSKWLRNDGGGWGGSLGPLGAEGALGPWAPWSRGAARRRT